MFYDLSDPPGAWVNNGRSAGQTGVAQLDRNRADQSLVGDGIDRALVWRVGEEPTGSTRVSTAV